MWQWVKKYWGKIVNEPNLSAVIFSLVVGLIWGIGVMVLTAVDAHFFDFGSMFPIWFIFSAFFIYPFTLTVANVGSLIFLPSTEVLQKKLQWTEYITLVLGVLYSVLYNDVFDVIRMDADWNVSIYYYESHTPIWTEARATILVLVVVAVAGYLVLSLVPLEKMPPLVIALSIAAMYIGVGVCIVWSIQISGIQDLCFNPETLLFVVLPFNFVVLTAKRIRLILSEQEQMEKLHRLPLLGFLVMWPMLGLLICILALFGQQPDAMIKAWTQTADWTLSTKLPAQSLEYDGHYLCTVAAGGHQKVVKPLRYGERHGHRVIVNRQLCVANAFEQLLEERMPVTHRHIRHFYDTCGFPIAKLIKTKLAADVVYILMKPLEWIFLLVLYLFDTKPENRIALQYLPPKDIRMFSDFMK